MVTLTIEVEDRVENALRQLAAGHQGDLGKALEELLAVHEGLELTADEFEEENEDLLRQMRDRSEMEFANGRVVSWEDLKARNQL